MADLHDTIVRLKSYAKTTRNVVLVRRKTIEEAVELLKEQQPKKVVYIINPWTKLPVSNCPCCGERVDRTAYGRYDKEQKYCPYCGQAIDWKDGEIK